MAALQAQTAELPDKYEIGVFGGGSFFQQVKSGLGTKLEAGPALGGRFTANVHKYIGIEGAYTYSINDVSFLTSAGGGLPAYSFTHHVHNYSLNPLIYLTERGRKFRPYLTAGISALNYAPTNAAYTAANVGTPGSGFGAQGLSNKVLPAFNYGGGFKYHFTERIGLQADVRGLLSQNPTYGLPRSPSPGGTGVYIPGGDKRHGVQTTVGLVFYMGKKALPPPPPPPPPPAPKALQALNGGTLSAGSGTLCQGRAITVRSSNASDPAGRQLTYKWKVNGQPMGSSSPELSFTPDRAGNYMIELEVQAPNTEGMAVRSATASTLALNVQEYRAPAVSGCTATPAALNYGQTASLSARGTGSACSTISFQWTSTEGTVSPATSANATFDSKSVRFEQGGKIQTKTVKATAKVTDDRGQSASCDVNIKVDYTPQAIRFSDVVFSKGGARVNNCGKRILIDELAPKAADPDYEVVLIGHYDQDETPKTKAQKAKSLDMERVMNALAVLTGGTGTCAKVDRSRVKIDYTGAEQVSDMQPGLCGTSTRTAAKERKANVVSTADQNRRVEVWLVPKGTKMPSGFKSAKDVSEKELKKLACPK
jgi:hypothetical protein